MGVYGANKFFFFPDQIEALKSGSMVAPVHVRIKPINHCNHACWYCAYRADNLSLGEDMKLTDRIPYEKMREIVADLIAMKVKAVTFSGGGEPLLYKILPECVEELASNGVRVAALTNGSNLKGKMADAFASWGTWIRVSLDAWDDESYAKSRSIYNGAFSALIKNMQSFAERGSACVLGVSLIIDQVNCAHIADICRLLKKVGVSHVKLSAAIVSNDIQQNNVYHQNIAKVVSCEIEEASQLNDRNFSVVNHYHEMDARFDKSYNTCPFTQFLTVIGADCGVYTCQDKAYSKSGLLGSVAKTSFRDLWQSDELARRLRKLNPQKVCAHHCVAHTKNLALHEALKLDTEHIPFV